MACGAIACATPLMVVFSAVTVIHGHLPDRNARMMFAPGMSWLRVTDLQRTGKHSPHREQNEGENHHCQ
ncbi:MAG: hypothetical protein AB2598_00265 [Candidatus Thiodiazotropha sp.]